MPSSASLPAHVRVLSVALGLLLPLGAYLPASTVDRQRPGPRSQGGTGPRRAAAVGVVNLPLLLSSIPKPPGDKADWLTYGYDPQRTGYNPAETGLGVGNAGALHELWSFDLAAATDATPVFAGNVVVGNAYVDLVITGAENGDLVAVNAATGQLVWRQNLGSEVVPWCLDLPGGLYGVTGSPALDRSSETVYAAGGTGLVYALDLATGAVKPGWPVAITDSPAYEHVYGAVTLWAGMLYLTTAGYCDVPPYHGKVAAVDTAGPRVSATWYPVDDENISGGGIWGPGGVSVDPAGGDVYVATGNALTQPEYAGYAEQVVRLTRDLELVAANYPGLSGGDVDFGATPLLYQPPGCPPQTVAENKSGLFLVYDRDAIASGPLQRLQITDNEELFIGLPAYSPVTNMLYVSSPSDSLHGPYYHGMIAFQVQADCSLQLAWQNTVGAQHRPLSPPTVANGVVYYGDGPGGRLRAFDAVTGDILWDSGPTIGGDVYAAPMVVNGHVYAGSWDGKLYAFGPE